MGSVSWTFLVGVLLLGAGGTSEAAEADMEAGEIRLCIPSLKTDNGTIDQSYRIAIGDLVGNVVPYQSGLLEHPTPVILAGLDYGRPWTRDASINAGNPRMNSRQLQKLGVPQDCMKSAIVAIQAGTKSGGLKGKQIKQAIKDVVDRPEDFTGDEHFGQFAEDLTADRAFVRPEPVDYRTWGSKTDKASHVQIKQACAVPMAAGAALMPDAHVGYDLPRVRCAGSYRREMAAPAVGSRGGVGVRALGCKIKLKLGLQPVSSYFAGLRPDHWSICFSRLSG